ncbi:glycosyltransferase [Marinobacter maroccanus]|uniref:glycosyltransferase n=1 Tax=Marinobacter maroccanus TaxID=2055143 RepID=UPI001304C903|nr:glycosyltransferase [Marinobacter maroccanus]
MSKKVLVVSYHFYPDQAVGAKRPTELTKSMIEEGWDVEVITKHIGKEAHEARVSKDSIGQIYSIYQHPGIIDPLWALVKRVRGHKKGKAQTAVNPEIDQARETQVGETLRFRLKRYIISTQATLNACKSWVLASLLFLLYLKVSGRHYDVVVTSSPPSSSHLIGLTAKWLFKATWITDIRDPINMWEEVLPVCKSRLREKVETDLERKYYKKSDALVVTSPSLKSELCSENRVDNNKVHLIYNGYDGELKPKNKKNNNVIRMIYAGTLYLNRDPFPVFEALKELVAESIINEKLFIFELFGNCKSWNGINLEDWLNENAICNLVEIHEYITGKELEKKLEAADILLNLAQGQKKQIPAKTFEYLRFRAVQFLVSEPDSDISIFLSSNKFGVVAQSTKEDVKEKLKTILSEVRNQRGLASEAGDDRKLLYARAEQNKEYISVIKNAG